jgi:hypothetical protein
LRAFCEVPHSRDELLAARKAAFFASEERVTGFFPLASARLWHSGVHLRGLSGSPVLAPARGRIVAARRGEGGSTSFVLLRHEVELDGRPLTFFSLLFHLSLPALSGDNPIPWMKALSTPEKAAHYIFLTDALAAHAGLPASQIIYSYHPITFLLVLAAQAAHVEIPWPRDHISDGGIETRRLAHVPLDDWTKPPASVVQELPLPPLIGVDLAPRPKDQIPLIELPPTDER